MDSKLFKTGDINLVIFSDCETEKYNKLISYLKGLMDKFNVTIFDGVTIDSISITRGINNDKSELYIIDLETIVNSITKDENFFNNLNKVFTDINLEVKKSNAICVVIARIHTDNTPVDPTTYQKDLPSSIILYQSAVIITSAIADNNFILNKSRDLEINKYYSMTDLL